MQIPNYWARATAEETDSRGKVRALSCWRSSDTSEQDAQQSALAAARRVLRSLLSGDRLDRYGYGDAPLREEVIQRFQNDDGELTAAVTRNIYGSLVLSTARVMFVDIDFPPVPAGAELLRLVGRMFGRKAPTAEEQLEAAVVERIRSFVARNAAWGVRSYRTKSGIRLLATHDLFDPAGGATAAAFDALGADPLYARLCKAHGSFRARLTPKPWRCGQPEPFTVWPRRTEEEIARFDAWQEQYKKCQAAFATCRYLETLGSGAIHPEAATIVEVHDHITQSSEPLALA